MAAVRVPMLPVSPASADEEVRPPLAPYIVITVYLLGSLVLFPVTLLTVATVFAFGPIAGYGYALLGCLLSAAFTFFLGRILGSDFVRRLPARVSTGSVVKLVGDVVVVRPGEKVPVDGEIIEGCLAPLSEVSP